MTRVLRRLVHRQQPPGSRESVVTPYSLSSLWGSDPDFLYADKYKILIPVNILLFWTWWWGQSTNNKRNQWHEQLSMLVWWMEGVQKWRDNNIHWNILHWYGRTLVAMIHSLPDCSQCTDSGCHLLKLMWVSDDEQFWFWTGMEKINLSLTASTHHLLDYYIITSYFITFIVYK